MHFFPSRSSREAPHTSPWRRIFQIVTILSLLILYSPILGLAIPIFSGSGPDVVHNGVTQLLSGTNLILLGKSLGLAAGSVLLAMIIAFFVGSWIWMRNGTAFENLRWLVVALIPVPAYIHALIWSSVLSFLGPGQVILGITLSPLQGWALSIWVQAMAMLPLATGIVILSLDFLDTALIDTARTFRPDRDVMAGVILPLASPLLLAGAGILFVLTITEYTIPSLFSVTVYSLGIFSAFSATNDPVISLILSIPLLVITVGVISWSASRLRCTFQDSSPCSYLPASRFVLPRPVRFLQSFFTFLFLGDIVLTGGILIWQTAFGKGGLLSLAGSSGDILYSLEIAGWAAMVSIPLALILAWNLHKGEWKLLSWILVIIPLAIPAPLVGIGLVSISAWLGTPLISNSVLLPVLASVTRFTPFAVLLLFSHMRSINPTVLDAGYVFGKSRYNILNTVELPLFLPGILASAGLMVVLTLGELGATLLVLAPGASTLTIRVYNYLHYGGSGTVAALCLAIMVIITLASVITIALIRRGQKQNRYPDTQYDEERS